MEAWLLKVVSTINGFLSDYLLIVLLVGVGVWYTVKTKFVQVCCFGQGMKNVFGSIDLNGKKQKIGHELFPSVCDGGCGSGRNGEYHRSFGCDPVWRPRRDLLDVDHCIPWYGNHLRRGGIGAKDAHRE